MSLLSELMSILDALNIPVETGIFSGTPPDEYAVLMPLSDDLTLFADNYPMLEEQEVRLSIFSKHNYRALVRNITIAMLAAGITITDRRYVQYWDDTGYHHYAVDAAKTYNFTEE